MLTSVEIKFTSLVHVYRKVLVVQVCKHTPNQTRTQSQFMCLGGERRLGVRVRRTRSLMERDSRCRLSSCLLPILAIILDNSSP